MLNFIITDSDKNEKISLVVFERENGGEWERSKDYYLGGIEEDLEAAEVPCRDGYYEVCRAEFRGIAEEAEHVLASYCDDVIEYKVDVLDAED